MQLSLIWPLSPVACHQAEKICHEKTGNSWNSPYFTIQYEKNPNPNFWSFNWSVSYMQNCTEPKKAQNLKDTENVPMWLNPSYSSSDRCLRGGLKLFSSSLQEHHLPQLLAQALRKQRISNTKPHEMIFFMYLDDVIKAFKHRTFTFWLICSCCERP